MPVCNQYLTSTQKLNFVDGDLCGDKSAAASKESPKGKATLKE
jgi:hypothetical protein